MIRSVFSVALFLIATTAAAQSPDGRGEVVLEEPFYKGVWADVDLPLDPGMRNEGGSDGAGLCVVTATLTAGRFQEIEALSGGKSSRYWTLAKSRKGGYWPGRLLEYLGEFQDEMPEVRWISWEGVSTAMIEEYTRQGIPVSCTTNTGLIYGMQGIHHFIVVIHLDESRAMIVDSNDPTHYHAMPREEFDRRFVDGEMGWLFIWLYGDATPPGSGAGEIWPAAVLLVASGVVVILGATL